jgi:hypothetical protein
LDAAIITACITLIGFIVVNFIAEDFRRFRNGTSVAAGLAGEIGSYKEPEELLKKYMLQMIQIIRDGNRAALPFRGIETPKDRIFDANLANLGLLGSDLVEEVAYVYGKINGFRVGFGLIHDQHAQMADNELIARLQGAHDTIEAAGSRGRALAERLSARAKLTFWDWLVQHFRSEFRPT